jgi:hypothetical protein
VAALRGGSRIAGVQTERRDEPVAWAGTVARAHSLERALVLVPATAVVGASEPEGGAIPATSH